eukprot:gnl/Chilomastix_caulleri/6524.p1 GENE.gnl/Chilomastix_caulleri/6524~~gnl/Chilomastix_caulleri/6524.p1  ORF type:complete len:73 (+),score=18.73 gnl/Chilomastix_caulleri/6524:28-246(+)
MSSPTNSRGFNVGEIMKRQLGMVVDVFAKKGGRQPKQDHCVSLDAEDIGEIYKCCFNTFGSKMDGTIYTFLN